MQPRFASLLNLIYLSWRRRHFEGGVLIPRYNRPKYRFLGSVVKQVVKPPRVFKRVLTTSGLWLGGALFHRELRLRKSEFIISNPSALATRRWDEHAALRPAIRRGLASPKAEAACASSRALEGRLDPQRL